MDKIQDYRTLILRSSDINPANDSTSRASYNNVRFENNNGVVDNNRYTNIWRNVNFRQVMGDVFFNSYERFGIYLAQATVTSEDNFNSGQVSNENRSLFIKISGLPLNPPFYNNATKTSTSNGVILDTIVLTQNDLGGGGRPAVILAPPFGGTTLFFDRCSDNIDLQIDLQPTSTNITPVVPASNVMCGFMEMVFTIYGVEPVNQQRSNIL